MPPNPDAARLPTNRHRRASRARDGAGRRQDAGRRLAPQLAGSARRRAVSPGVPSLALLAASRSAGAVWARAVVRVAAATAALCRRHRSPGQSARSRVRGRVGAKWSSAAQTPSWSSKARSQHHGRRCGRARPCRSLAQPPTGQMLYRWTSDPPRCEPPGGRTLLPGAPVAPPPSGRRCRPCVRFPRDAAPSRASAPRLKRGLASQDQRQSLVRVPILFDEPQIATPQRGDRARDRAAEPKDLLVVAVLKGSFMFAADLIRALHRAGLAPQVEFMHLSSYRAGTVSSGQVAILRDVESEVRGRDVLLVDDILESGRTLAFAKDLLAARGARRVLTAVLLEKPGKRAGHDRRRFRRLRRARTCSWSATAWTSRTPSGNCRSSASSTDLDTEPDLSAGPDAMARILIADDEEPVRGFLERGLRDRRPPRHDRRATAPRRSTSSTEAAALRPAAHRHPHADDGRHRAGARGGARLPATCRSC